MPMYEYSCECGGTFEALEKVSEVRFCCASDCILEEKNSLYAQGQVQRLVSPPCIRGDGREATEQVFDPCKQSGRPYADCEYDQ